uniref:Secreted RxLR effector protein 89 n=1 Tax=Plasmopara viticola TaxID=143451 RepID=RLR89_PLAVT|nr:RecName: Full=Secreted RxLR effector protein 89; Flags: Precursor [Plasmopara viticola]
MTSVVIVVSVAVLLGVLVITDSSWPCVFNSTAKWSLQHIESVTLERPRWSRVKKPSSSKWRHLRTILQWWQERRKQAHLLDTWQKQAMDMDECLTRYRDAKHDDICVISE